jgi:beta-galactosidase
MTVVGTLLEFASIAHTLIKSTMTTRQKILKASLWWIAPRIGIQNQTMKKPNNPTVFTGRDLSIKLGCWAAGLALILGASGALAGRECVSFNDDWRFTQDDPAGTGEQLSYANLKPWLLPSAAAFTKNNTNVANAKRPEGNIGADVAYTQSSFDDSNWRKVNLPHDWAIEGPFKQEYPGRTGKLKFWGAVWYRKDFTLPAGDAGKQIYLDVDGAMSYASVWVNGQFAGGWPYGYASWRVDLTPFVKPGAENVVAIRLDSPAESSRWYPGGGIYRNVWLVKTEKVNVGQWGNTVVASVDKDAPGSVRVTTAIENQGSQPAEVSATTEFFELKANGERGAKVHCEAVHTPKVLFTAVKPGQTGEWERAYQIHRPKLWSIKQPNRYVAVTKVEVGGKVVDEVETPFGFRSIQFTKDNGFLLNGERLPLNGVCNHHDLGALGGAFNTRAAERQLEILKEMGCNAIRTSHNPPAPELLDLCDRLGFVVMDEAFDCWTLMKKTNDYHLLFEDWHEADLRSLVRRDRNHPSIVFWSMGNEIPEQEDTNRFYVARALRNIVREEDPTRPVTAGCDRVGAGLNGFQRFVDVFGYNYKPAHYQRFRRVNPDIPLYSSESASCISSRGEYFFPVSDDQSKGKSDFQMSSYDLYAPHWAMPPEVEFRAQDEFPYVAGEFVWTGFDYLGEPTPYNADASNLLNFTDPAEKARAEKELKKLGKIRTPSRSSYFGIIDLAGFPKDRYYLYQSRWRPELPMAHILPHWNWPERVGQVTPVHVYTSGDSAELFLNGKSLGKKSKGKFEYRLRWDDVVYEPGELKVVAYKNGKKWATDVMNTTGPAAKLELTPDRAKISADGKDLSFVTVKVADRDGLLVPRSKNELKFKISGPGEIVATDNGDATSFESFQAPERKAFNGLALVIVRAKAGESGKITLTAEADGLKSGECVIRGLMP